MTDSARTGGSRSDRGNGLSVAPSRARGVCGMRHVPLERAETVLHNPIARRRATLQHEMAAALAEGDRELVSRARAELEALQVGRGGGVVASR